MKLAKNVSFKDAISFAFIFMSNNEAGFQATYAIASELESHEIQVASVKHLYYVFKDLNDAEGREVF